MGHVICQSDGFLVLSYVFSALDWGNLDCCLWLVSLVGFFFVILCGLLPRLFSWWFQIICIELIECFMLCYVLVSCSCWKGQ